MSSRAHRKEIHDSAYGVGMHRTLFHYTSMAEDPQKIRGRSAEDHRGRPEVRTQRREVRYSAYGARVRI